MLNLIVIRSGDMERAVQFYELLGLTFAKHRHDSGPEHFSADMNGCVFEIYPRRSEADSTASVRLGFQVADVDSLVSELIEAGIKIVTEPANTEWGRRAVVEDSDGHRIEIVSAKASVNAVSRSLNIVTSNARLTPEQYLEKERMAETRSEYVKGRIIAREPSNLRHCTIASNLLGELRQQLKNRPCKVYTSNMRLHIEGADVYAYPDVSVVGKEVRFQDKKQDSLLNPIVLFEILSPATEAYDRGGKFAHYRRIPSLQEYVMVAQDRALVEHYARQDEQWTLTQYRGFEATLELPSIQCRIPLAEIYDKVTFPSAAGAEENAE